ncbi:thioredoxin family protein [Runella salmonicolor]|uniref:Thioredoxin family protein n=1 Tax=Runella salmonicolor TaxID=2950278 RepID=A0ABT1FZS9_9BACT|nr:thioredoxin family protein [Runella salmonicolor]MCP1386308.1 thioredoxin family protein [Runella salmonicolor]
MEFTVSHPIQIPSQSADLLIFMPSAPGENTLIASLNSLADLLQNLLGTSVHVFKIDEMTYPGIVKSFDIFKTPTFVLVQRGVEVWRQIGMTDAPTIIKAVKNQLTD